MLAMAGEHHSKQRYTNHVRPLTTTTSSPPPSMGGRPRGETHQTAAAAVAATVDLLALAASRATSRSSCAQHRSGRGAAWSTCPRPPQPTRPPPRRSEGPPAAQHCPGLAEAPSPPGRRREAAAARGACPKSPMSARLALRRRRLLPEADAACVPLALTRTLGCRPATGRVCSIAVVSTAPRWRMRAVLAAPPVMGYVVHRCS